MRWFDQLQLRLRTIFRRARVDDELQRELQFHLDQQIAENLAVGMSLTAARSSVPPGRSRRANPGAMPGTPRTPSARNHAPGCALLAAFFA